MRRHLFATAMILSLVPLPLGTPSAEAGTPAVCNVYSAAAVSQQQKNQNLGCGYAGPRWSKNFAGHFAWCMGAGAPAIQAETNARAAMLAACAGGGGGNVTKTFTNPKVNGMRVDWCYKWAKDCGGVAAKYFCKVKGYGAVKTWGLAENIGTYTNTLVLGTGQVCKGKFCDGFSFITCKK